VLSVRDGLEFGSEIRSDTAALNTLVAALVGSGSVPHVLRDPTRGGVAATLNEIAAASSVGIVLDERSIPVPDDVRAACGFLGLDPLYVANEGRLVAFVSPESAHRSLEVMQGHPLGAGACMIGTHLLSPCPRPTGPPLGRGNDVDQCLCFLASAAASSSAAWSGT
jgi:hydrogenase expression/formation protein HypE